MNNLKNPLQRKSLFAQKKENNTYSYPIKLNFQQQFEKLPKCNPRSTHEPTRNQDKTVDSCLAPHPKEIVEQRIRSWAICPDCCPNARIDDIMMSDDQKHDNNPEELQITIPLLRNRLCHNSTMRDRIRLVSSSPNK